MYQSQQAMSTIVKKIMKNIVSRLIVKKFGMYFVKSSDEYMEF